MSLIHFSVSLSAAVISNHHPDTGDLWPVRDKDIDDVNGSPLRQPSLTLSGSSGIVVSTSG